MFFFQRLFFVLCVSSSQSCLCIGQLICQHFVAPFGIQNEAAHRNSYTVTLVELIHELGFRQARYLFGTAGFYQADLFTSPLPGRWFLGETPVMRFCLM